MISASSIKQIIFKTLIVFGALAMLLVISYGAARAEQPTVTANYLYDLTGYGTDSRFDHPQDIFVDGEHGEVFVADSRGHRVKIFNTSGMLLFQFGSSQKMRTPSSVAVDSRGFIYVVHGYRGGRHVSVYNYRGIFQRTLSFEDLPLDVSLVQPNGVAVDGADRLYVLDDNNTVKRFFVFGPDGEFIKSIRIMADLDEKMTKESFCGRPYIAKDGTLYVSNPMVGTVYAYSPDGEFLRTIGEKGSTPGKLTFPADVAEDSEGHVLVLDSMRNNVVIFERDGRFVSEFGGFGLRDGWFYSPISIAVDPENRAYIGQVVNDRVQVLQLNGLKRADTRVSLKNPETKGGDSSSTLLRGPSNTQ